MNPMRIKTVPMVSATKNQARTVPRVSVTKNLDSTNRVVHCPEGVSILCKYCGTKKTDHKLDNALWLMWFHQTAVHNRNDPEPAQPSKEKTPEDPEPVQPSGGKTPETWRGWSRWGETPEEWMHSTIPKCWKPAYNNFEERKAARQAQIVENVARAREEALRTANIPEGVPEEDPVVQSSNVQEDN